jgi:hypothetical protein
VTIPGTTLFTLNMSHPFFNIGKLDVAMPALRTRPASGGKTANPARSYS